MADKIPTKFEVTATRGYNPSRNKIDSLSIRYISDKNIYNLVICKAKTMFGNIVRTYDSETFIKAVKYYAKRINNQTKLLKYVNALGVEEKVFEIMELLLNDD